jgi:hypothetical protein
MPKNANGEGSIYKRMKDGKLIRFERCYQLHRR